MYKKEQNSTYMFIPHLSPCIILIKHTRQCPRPKLELPTEGMNSIVGTLYFCKKGCTVPKCQFIMQRNAKHSTLFKENVQIDTKDTWLVRIRAVLWTLDTSNILH